MKYYLIVGEASGDLHASHLMRSIQKLDPQAEFRFFGGDNMIAVGGTCVRHFKTLAYMGFIPVLMHLRTITKGMKQCREDIIAWQPDVVIPVDYAGFNLSICQFIRKSRNAEFRMQNSALPKPRIFYYISPKIWAWKEYRIKRFKRDVDEMFSILPFEVDFFEKKYNYPIHYVGNPTADEVRKFRSEYAETHEEFCQRVGLDPKKPIVALMPGSRKQEVKDNLPAMLEAISLLPDADRHQYAMACVPSIDDEFYRKTLNYKSPTTNHKSPIDLTCLREPSAYPLLNHAACAIVTSGTATLETALFDVPQVVCYKTPLPRIMRWGFNHIIKCKYISLVNLIADREVVQELFADRFSPETIARELHRILPGGEAREQMLSDYKEVKTQLGDAVAPDNAARIMLELMK